MKNLKTILSTKILSTTQKQVLLNANLNVIDANFIETKFIDFELKNIKQIVIFTSQNAVLAVLNHLKIEELKAKTTFCVGLKTKALLQENGFKVEAYTSYAQDLAEIISLIYSNETFTFFSGNLRRDTLPNALSENGIRYNEILVYETISTPQKINIKLDGILFLSPSAVNSYLELNKISSEICFALGTTTAQELASNSIKNIEIATSQTIESVIDKVINY